MLYLFWWQSNFCLNDKIDVNWTSGPMSFIFKCFFLLFYLQIFTINDTYQQFNFGYPFIAKSIKVVPVEWQNYPCVHIQLFGCHKGESMIHFFKLVLKFHMIKTTNLNCIWLSIWALSIWVFEVDLNWTIIIAL